MSVDVHRRCTAWLLGTILFASYAYFYQAGGWNQNSRFALTSAIIEHHSVRIDPYADRTGDRALWRGHYYSDKAPGAALLAVVPVTVARGVARLAGVDPGSRAGVAWTSYVATVATSGLFTVLSALAIFGLSQAWGFSLAAATFAALAYGLATPAWCYATLFMGHAQTAGCLMVAFAAAVALGSAEGPRIARLAGAVGLATIWAVVTEFPAAVPAALIGAFAVASVDGWAERRTVIVWIAAGGALALAILLAYNQLAFRSPFHLGYQSEEGFEHLNEGLFGITYPRWFRLREILIGSYRGLLPIAPVMALTPAGLLLLLRKPAACRAATVAAAAGLFYLVLNASYYYWEGGWSFGPRQMAPGLPFLAIGLAPLWDRWRRLGRTVLIALGVWGASVTLVAVATTAQPPASVERPLHDLLWPAFRDGDLSLNNQGFMDFRAHADALRGNPLSHAAWNVGELLGLRGQDSLIPLVLIWGLAVGLYFNAAAAARGARR
jgi:hypothetical protein